MKYLLLLVLPTVAFAQFPPLPPPPPPVPPPGMMQPPPNPLDLLPYEGSEIFRFLLHRQGLKPVQRVAEVLAEPANSIIIVHGDTPDLRDQYSLGGMQLRDFIMKGGAVLIAGDSNTDNRPNAWSGQFGIQREGKRLKADAADCYRATETRPFIRPVLSEVEIMRRNETSPHKMFANIKWSGPAALATDLPSAMYTTLWNAGDLIRIPLATYPRSANYVAIRDGEFGPAGCYFAVAYTAQRGSGRMLVLADHSVFVNGMTGFKKDDKAELGLSTDNYNSVFIKQMTEWLQAGSPEKRTQCLFIEDGETITKFAEQIRVPPQPNQQQPPVPPLHPEVIAAFGNVAVQALEKGVVKAEENDSINRFLLNRISRDGWVKFVVIVFMVWAFVFALRRFGRSLWQVNPSATPSPNALESLLPHGGITQQRVDAQIDVNNFYEAARSRVRDRYDRMGGQPTADGKIPPVMIASGGRDAERLLEAICGLWLIGYGTKPVHVGPGEWDTMNRDLEATLKRARRGEWSFGQEV